MTDIGPRYPISVRISGVLLHEKTKLYMAQVLWSDQNEIAVYRGLDEYMAIHKRMKKIFPSSSPLKKSDRTIPKFRDVKMKRNVKKKGTNRSVQRCTFLEKYCNDLLCCDPQVTQNSELAQFFHPREQDLQQDFIKNCIMIVPSDQLDGGGGGGRSHFNQAANITQPFVTGTYRCVAPFDTKDTKNRAFKVAVDEKLEVLIKDQAGWWLVENESKHMAWFPAPYLERVVDDEDDDYEEDDDMDGPHGGGAEYIAVRTYKATKGDELSVEIGTRVEVLQKSDNGWWLIRHKGKGGYVPALFLQPYTNPCNRLVGSRSPTPGGFSPQFQHSHSLEVAPSSPRVSPTMVQHSHSLDVVPTRSHSAIPPRGGGGHHTLDILSAARSRSVSPLAQSPRVSPTAVQQQHNNSHSPEVRRAVRFVASPASNELQLPVAEEKQRSRSLPVVVMPDAQQLQFAYLAGQMDSTLPVGASTPVVSRANKQLPTSPTTPVITVEGDAAGGGWTGQTQVDNEDSEDSFGSDSSEFSIDGLSSSSAGSSFNLDGGGGGRVDERQQPSLLGYTPPPPPPTGRQSSSNYLSPNAGAAAGAMMHATSDPSLYKRPTSPRVPPRPKAKEILSRCSTVTRKNLAARAQSPAQITSR